MDSTWVEAFLLEQTIAHAISSQAKHGCNFNVPEATRILAVLDKSVARLDRRLIKLLPPDCIPGVEINKPFKLNGKLTSLTEKRLIKDGWSFEDMENVVGPLTTLPKFIPFDMSKTTKLKEVMFDFGWIPDTWNEKKNIWKPFRKTKLSKSDYSKILEEMREDDLSSFVDATNNYYNKHFNLSTGKVTEGHRKALLRACGFRTAPKTLEEYRRHMLQLAFWPTSAQITETSFDSVSKEHGIAMTLLKKRMVTMHRRGVLAGLLEKLRKDGKLSGEANPCATPTARMTHRIIANIPANGSPLGARMRDLFMGNYDENDVGGVRRFLNISDGEEHWCEVPDGQQAFVGGDGAGLELRMLAHYLVYVPTMLLEKKDFKLFTEKQLNAALESALAYRSALLDGDIHTHNQHLAGLPTRKQAKTFIYAFLYGAGNANLGAQLGGDTSVGLKARETFLRECPCIPVLIEYIQWFASEYGYVPGVDGRQLRLRKDDNGKLMTHKALNLLLQAAGSIVMKISDRWLIEQVELEGLDAHQVIFYHDECQWTCRCEHVARLRELIDQCVKKAGESLGMCCPLASDSKAGKSWLDTH